MIQKVGYVRAMKVLHTVSQRRFNAFPQAYSEWERLNKAKKNPWEVCPESFEYQMKYPMDDQIAFDVFNGTFIFASLVKGETYDEFLKRVGPEAHKLTWHFPS